MPVKTASEPVPVQTGRAEHNAFVTVLAIVLVDGAYYATMPLLPDFLKQIGITSAAAVAGWTGILMGITPALAAAAGPLWGKVGDRTGLKLMALRSTAVLALAWIGCALVGNIWQLLGLRILLGFLGGYQTIVMALATHGAYPLHTGRVIARVQMTQITTAALAPVAGGSLSTVVGVRWMFVLSGLFCVLAVALFQLFYTDVERQPAPHLDAPAASRASTLRWLAFLLFIQSMVDRSFQPAATLWAAVHAHNRAESAQIAGLILGIGALGDGLAAWYCGRIRNAAARRTLLIRSLAGTAVCAALGFAFSIPALLALRLLLSIVASGGMTVFYTMASRIVPESRRSSDFALLSSCALFGQGAGSLAAGLLASRNISYVFWWNGLLYAAVALLVARLRSIGRLGEERQP